MSEINIRRTHSLTLDDAREVAEGIAAKLEKDFGLDCSWKRNVLHFERPGVNGQVHVTDHDVRLEAKLGLLLGFLKPQIEQEIEAQFDRYFKPNAAKKVAATRPTPARSAADRPQKVPRRRRKR